MQLVLSIGPPSKVLRERYIHFQSSCLHKTTVTKAFYTKQLLQDREHCLWTSRLQSFVVSLIEEELPVQCEVNNIHDDFAVAVLKNSNTVGHVPQEIPESAGTSCRRVAARWPVSSMVTGDDLKSMGKDSWFHVCTSSKGNKNTLRDW